MLPVSLDYSFLIDPSIFSNVYMYKSLTGDTIVNHLSEVNCIGPVRHVTQNLDFQCPLSWSSVFILGELRREVILQILLDNKVLSEYRYTM